MWECVTSTLKHINQADGSSCGNSEKIRNSACGTISAHCLICAISCLVHLPHICVLIHYFTEPTLKPYRCISKQWLHNLKHINKWSQFHGWTVPTTANGVSVSPLVFGPLISGWLQGQSPLSTKCILSPPMQLLQQLRSTQG